MFNRPGSTFVTDMTKRLTALNVIPSFKDAVIAFKEENVKEINRILTAFSEIGELPKSLSGINLNYELLCDESRFFDAFKTIHLIAVFLTDPKTTAIIRERLITRYPFDMKNMLFIRLNTVSTFSSHYLDLLCFYFERDYQHEFGEGRRDALTRWPAPRHENSPG